MDNLLLFLFLVSFIALIVGLIKPAIFSLFIKGQITRKKITTIFGIAAIATFILFGLAIDNQKHNQAAQQQVTENKQVVIKNENKKPTTVTKKQAPAKTEIKTDAKPSIGSFGNGTFLVGSDIKAGTYRSQGENTCYWARQKGFSGQLNDIIANGNNSPEIVTIDTTDAAFQTSGCGQWIAIENTYPILPASFFANGTYEVGKHIVSGTYRADGLPDSICYWARLSNFSHSGIGGIIANGNSPTIIQISPNDKGFTTFGCGTWKKLE